MTKTVPSQLVAVLIGLLCVSLITTTPTQAYALGKMFPKQPPVHSTTHVDDTIGFQFEPPKKWISVDTGEWIAEYVPNDESAGAILVVRHYQNAPMNFKDWKNEFEKLKIQSINPEFYFKLNDDLKFNMKFGQPKIIQFSDGAQIRMQGNMILKSPEKNLILSINIVNWHIPEQGDRFTMMYIADTNSYKKYFPAFEKSVKSFYAYPTDDLSEST